MILDLILSFCLLTIFTFFFEHFMMDIHKNMKANSRYIWKVGLYQGFVGIILMYVAGHSFGYCMITDLSVITILISSSIGGPYSAAITMLLILAFRVVFEPSTALILQAAPAFILILLTCNAEVRFIKGYWLQWVVSVSFSNLVLLLIYRFMKDAPPISAGKYFFLVYEASGLFIAAKLYYMINAQRLKCQFDDLQGDLLEILHMQPGMIYKLSKENDKIKYKIAGGALFSELGISLEDLVGKTLDQITLFPEELASFLQLHKERVWAGEQVSYEISLSGHTLLVNLKPVLYDQIVGSVIGSVMDISERKASEKQLMESEELYRSLVESSQDFIVRFDVEGRITSVNKRVSETLRLPQEELIGTMIKDLITPGEHMEVWLYYFGQVFNRRTMESFEYSFRSRSREHNYDVTLSPFYDVDQNIIGITCSAHDITNLKRRREADEANKAKSEFLARMSHEIRTPLSGIIGLTELLTRQELTPVQMDYLNKILSSSHTLLGIINDVLDFSKIEAGKIELQKGHFNLHQLMQELSDILAILVGQKRLKFIIDTSADIPDTLYGDSLRIEQILINMINNAIKFTDSGYIYVKADLAGYEEEQIHVEFTVEDTGIGITGEQAARLFEPFMQVGHYSTQKNEGTGLGLPICKYFIDLMGGSINVNSKPGYGSIFSFILPFEVIPQEHQSHREEQMEFAQKKILVIESNLVIRNGICSMLETMNFDVIVAGSQTEVDIEQSPVEVILTDLCMETTEGLSSWLQLKKRTSTCPVRHVAVLTAELREEIMKLPVPLQPDIVLLMPVSRNGLYDSMKSLFMDEVNDTTRMYKPEAGSLPGHPMNILLAEDNEINQLVVTELLEAHSFKVSIAHDGCEVLHMLDAGQWDLLLLDIHMPVLDGVETTRIIRDNRKYDSLPIIALTANTVKEEHEMYIRIGMNGVLTKPFQVRQLVEWMDWQARDDLDSVEIEGIDLHTINQRIEGKTHLLIHMFDVFLRDYSVYMDNLRNAWADYDLSRVRRMLHTLKGVAGNLSAERLEAAAGRLEELLERGGEMENGMAELDQEMDRILTSLQRFVDNGCAGGSMATQHDERIV